MFGQLTNLFPEKALARNHYTFEPHVEFFDILSSDKQRVNLPFQVTTSMMIFLLAVGFCSWIVWEENIITYVCIGLFALFIPFYLPYMVYYLRYFSREEHTEVEIDSKHGFIKYTNRKNGRNLLFHKDQIIASHINHSLLFPFRIDYIDFELMGGERVIVSSLVIDPRIVVRDLTIPYYVVNKIFNWFPAGA